jgi:hypothetical protein
MNKSSSVLIYSNALHRISTQLGGFMPIEINKNLMNKYDENGKCFIVQTLGPALQNFLQQ